MKIMPLRSSTGGTRRHACEGTRSEYRIPAHLPSLPQRQVKRAFDRVAEEIDGSMRRVCDFEAARRRAQRLLACRERTALRSVRESGVEGCMNWKLESPL